MNSPKIITQLAINEIFVFGSNTAGRHGKGAALQALKFGAVYGKGLGLAGRTYAIPTKDGNLQVLPLSRIFGHVCDFITLCSVKPKYNFLVTEIGCGLAGYTPQQIAPLFKEATKLENILLPESFTTILMELV
jgi:hypothetical protein